MKEGRFKNPDKCKNCRLGGLWGVIYCNFCEKGARKLRRIILLHFGTPENPSCSWFSDSWTCVWFPNQLLWILDTPQSLQRIQDESRTMFQNATLGKIEILETEQCDLLGKDSCHEILKICLILFEKLEYGINIYQKTWNGDSVIWDQYLSKNMKWKFGNMGSISIKTWHGNLVIFKPLSDDFIFN